MTPAHGRRLRVLFVTPSLGAGGAERVLVTLLTHFDRRRIDATLVVLDGRRMTLAPDLPADVPVVALRAPRVVRGVPSIVRLAWRLRPDVLFSTLSHLNLALAAVRWAMPPGLRMIGRETSIVSSTVATYRFSGAWRLAYRRIYRRLDTIVCQSRTMRDDLLREFAMPVTSLALIGNPIDLQRVRSRAGVAHPAPGFRAGRFNLVFCGRLSHEKGVDLLLEAIVAADMPDLDLTVVGTGPLADPLAARAAALGLAGRVRWLGHRDNPMPYIAQADALVLSSRFEGFPNVVLEALACGTPVIATPAPGGLAEIVDGVEGCVVADEVSAPALAAAIAAFRARGAALRCAPGSVDRFDVSRIVRRYEALIAGERSSADA